jgi:hypothetical protein
MRTPIALPLMLLTLTPSAPLGQEPQVDVLALLQATEGTWEGVLEYRDRKGGERVELPTWIELELAQDSSYVLRRARFQDPGRAIHALDVVTRATEGNALVVTSVAPGPVETSTLTVAECAVDGPRSWRVVFVSEVQEARRPAELRTTLILEEDELRSVEEVRPLGVEGSSWTFRNGLRLRRPALDAGALVGTWTVDLRPTPDAEPYLKTFVVRSVADGRLEGTFYDTPIREGHLDTAWGAVRFAFVTEDGTGVYHTSGTLENGRLEGTTHSLGRGFLQVWSAVRAE